MQARKLSTVGNIQEGDFPVAEKAAKEVLALPVYPELTNEMQDYAVKSILDFL